MSQFGKRADGTTTNRATNGETKSGAALDGALAAAREEGRRLFTFERGLIASGAAAGALVGLRGAAAVAWPEKQGAPSLAIGLTLALAAAGGLLVWALRARQRWEDVMRDVQALELARDALAHDARPTVEIHPYREKDGAAPPVVVVRTDHGERLFRERDAPPSPPAAWLTRAMAAVAVVCALVFGASLFVEGAAVPRQRWTFLDEAQSLELLGLRVSAPRGGTWSVEQDRAATGARALVNRVGDEDAPPATLVASAVRGRDVHVTTRCRVSGDHQHGACGVVFRHADEGSHHVARIEPGTGRVVLGRVSGGAERVLAAADARVLAGVWHELTVDARGDALRVACDGRVVIDVRDVLPAPIGSVGLWAPSGNEAFFDELAVEVFPAAPQAIEVLPVLQKRKS